MDKETGETLTDETGDIIKGGTVVTKSSEAGIDGEASPSLTLSEKTLADLRGKSIVCCVKLYKRNADGTPDYSRIYAVHNDIEDADETLPFAKVVTELTEKETGHHEVLLKNSDTVLTDTVKFENLPKKGFSSNMKITGTLVNASGSPVKAEDGTPIQDTISVSETEDFSKTYTLEYTIPSSILRKYEGKSMHSFVEVKMGEEIWTYEKDTKNAAQSITIPTIKETQTDKDILVSKDTGITDLVKMEGLIKGNTYTLVGINPCKQKVYINAIYYWKGFRKEQSGIYLKTNLGVIYLSTYLKLWCSSQVDLSLVDIDAMENEVLSKTGISFKELGKMTERKFAVLKNTCRERGVYL